VVPHLCPAAVAGRSLQTFIGYITILPGILMARLLRCGHLPYEYRKLGIGTRVDANYTTRVSFL